MSISIDLAEKMLIKFDGNKSKLLEFIDNCDKAYFLVKEGFKPALFAIIETKLTDNARALTRNRTFADWASLKTYLLDAYSERRTMGQWQLELHSCKQNFNESIMIFANKVENCYIKLLNSLDATLSAEAREACVNMLKMQALNVFLTGLNKELSILVKSQKPETLESAISIALSEEQELKSKSEIQKYQNVNNSFSKLCSFCNKTGHSNFNCRYKQNQYTRNTEKNVRYFQNDHRRTSNYNNNPSTSFQTYTNKKFCNYCKKPNHLINECRKRQYNNNRKREFISDNTDSSSADSENLPNISEINLNSQGPRQSTAAARNANLIQAVFQ